MRSRGSQKADPRKCEHVPDSAFVSGAALASKEKPARLQRTGFFNVLLKS
jgi:hypothetical protein